MMSDRNKLQEIMIGGLAIISIILIMVISLASLSPEWLFILYIADLIICMGFAWDYFSRYLKAPDRSWFLKQTIYEILTLVPAIAFYPIGQLFGLAAFLRALRLMRVIFVLARTIRPIHPAYRFAQKYRLI